MKIKIDDELIKVDVQYGKRKKLSIQMDAFGFITVKAPKGISEAIIVSTIQNNGKKILEKRREIEGTQEGPQPRMYQTEGKFLYLGKEHFLHELIETNQLDEEVLKKNLKRFYMTSCKKIVEERIKIYQKQLKVKPKSIDIISSTVKWGSCSSDRHLAFNYRLAMAPVDVIDYVVIHELCHIHHMNHDRSFWRLVGSIMPDYKEKEAYLARHGRSMTY